MLFLGCKRFNEFNAKDLQEMIQLCFYAKEIKNYCKHTNCNECCFDRDNECVIGHSITVQQDWDDDGYIETQDITYSRYPKEWKI